MSFARRTVLALCLLSLTIPGLARAAEPATPDSVPPPPEVRERELKAKVSAHPKEASYVVELGKFYYDQGDRSRAEKQFRRALEFDPRSSAAMVQLGTVLNESGKSQEALAQFDAALALDPRNVDTMCRKGQALYALKRQEEAIRLYLDAKKIDPKAQAPFYWLGIAFADAGIYREAIVEWTAVVELGKDTELGRAAAEGMEVLRPMIGNPGP